MPRRSRRARERGRRVTMSVRGLRRSESHGKLRCSGLPWPALLILQASTPGTVGPRTQGRPHRFTFYWRGALSAAWTNPESRLIPSPTLSFPHPHLCPHLALYTLALARIRCRAYSTRTGSRRPSRTWSRTSRETRRSGPSLRWLRNAAGQGTNSSTVGADEMANGGHFD